MGGEEWVYYTLTSWIACLNMLAVIIYVSIMLATLISYVRVAVLGALIYYGFHCI
jgi:hypothetical protein